jgi:hypothetical protein
MSSTDERDAYLLILKALLDRNPDPVLISDIRAILNEVTQSQPDLRSLRLVDSTSLFHLLRRWAAEGLVALSPKGYSVTQLGEREADSFARKKPEIANEVRRTAELVHG